MTIIFLIFLESTTEAYVETVDDGIVMGYDEQSYSYLQIIKHR